MELEKKLEALLFFKGEPVTIKDAAKMLSSQEKDVRKAAETLHTTLAPRGIVLLMNDNELSLGTSPDVSDLILRIREEELSRDLGKAGLETLSIILYKGPVSRMEIDYIRGVNSSFILRNLLIRGLIERIPNPRDSRSFLYKPTTDLISHLGITRIEELPDHEKVIGELAFFMERQEKEKNASGISDDHEENKNIS